jgi:alanine dehydrogenase
MIIGIPRETKVGESRVALIPEHVALLAHAGHRVRVEKRAGRGSKFSNKDYVAAGARIVDDVRDCEMIVRVKKPTRHSMKPGQTIMAYLHVQKGQDPLLLEALLDARVTAYAFEEIRARTGERLINLGVEAGVVGMYEGLRVYGKVLTGFGIENAFRALRSARKCFSTENILAEVDGAHLSNSINVYILGRGRVSQGAQQVLARSRIRPKVLWRKETAQITRRLHHADIVVNAVDWYPNEPRIIRKEMLRSMRKTAVIVDVTCDANGAVETCIPTTWHHPTYTFNGITHLCVDNLPSAIPRDSSVRLSGMIIGHVLKVAGGSKLCTGLMTKNGEFAYRARQRTSAKTKRKAR